MRKPIVFAITLQLFSFTGLAHAADEDGGISGRIKDSSGHPVSNARVSIENKSDFTDNEGRYRIKGLAPGSYEVQVKKDGRKVVDTVEIKDDVMEKDLSLKK